MFVLKIGSICSIFIVAVGPGIHKFSEQLEHVHSVLSEFYFKQREYDRAFDVKKDGTESEKINFNDWLTFANECRKENQFKISIEAYNFILGQKINSNWAGKALLGLAQTFEDQIIPIQESHLIPYFFDNNLFFEDPFQLNSTLSS